MNPEDAFIEKPIYRWEDVITKDDLRIALHQMLALYELQPKSREKDDIGIAVKTIDTMLTWIEDGKPDNFAIGG